MTHKHLWIATKEYKEERGRTFRKAKCSCGVITWALVLKPKKKEEKKEEIKKELSEEAKAMLESMERRNKKEEAYFKIYPKISRHVQFCSIHNLNFRDGNGCPWCKEKSMQPKFKRLAEKTEEEKRETKKQRRRFDNRKKKRYDKEKQ